MVYSEIYPPPPPRPLQENNLIVIFFSIKLLSVSCSLLLLGVVFPAPMPVFLFFALYDISGKNTHTNLISKPARTW